ncbi:hypothetical protein LWE69_11460 [Paenibacillus sp. UKAQ_18]|nr:hypothetical protein [Paenibacillus sp. UKAQ_18]
MQNHSRLFATQEMWFLLSLYDLPQSHARPYGGTGILRQFFEGMVPPTYWSRPLVRMHLKYIMVCFKEQQQICLSTNPRVTIRF